MSNENNNQAAPAQSLETANQENETTQESAEAGEETEANAETADASAAKPGVTKQEAKKIEKQLKKLKLKVDNKETEEEFDLSDDEFLTKQFQLAKVAQKRMSEHAELEKEVRSFINELRKNPRKVLSDPTIGIDLKKLAAEMIEEEIQNSQKSPEQLEKERLENELKSMKEEREREKEEHRQKEFQRLQEQEYQRYDTLIAKALETSDLPKSPYVVKKIADYMLMALNEGVDVLPEDVVPLVREEMQMDLKEMFALMPEDVIEKIVGKDVITRIRKKSVLKAKQNPAVNASTKGIRDVGQGKVEEEQPIKKKTIKEMFGI